MEKIIQNKIEKLVKTSIENISELVDVGKVVGKPQAIGEKIIVPICKVTTCFLSAGGETSGIDGGVGQRSPPLLSARPGAAVRV